MKISILISTFNGEADIRRLLDSIAAADMRKAEWEVILRDDASTDKSVTIIKEAYPWVHLIEDDNGNLGFVASNNIAFTLACGDIICCLNQDTIVHPKFFSAAIELYSSNKKLCGINTNMIMPWIMTLPKFLRTDEPKLPTHEYQLTRYGYVQYTQVIKNIHPSNFMTGGGLFIRKSALTGTRFLFDPDIDMYCEDSELALRITSGGGQILYCPTSIVYHNQATKQGKSISELFKLFRVTRNRFALFATIKRPLSFVAMYPLLLIGIVKKIAYLGLPQKRAVLAYIASSFIAILFILLFPYWLSRTLTTHPKSISF